jgi:hypothetical protein
MNTLKTSTIKEDHSLRDVRFHKTAKNKRAFRFRLNPFSKKSSTEQTAGNEETVNMYCKATKYGNVEESEARQRQLLMFLAGNLPQLDLVIDSKTGIFLDSDEMCSQLKYLLQTSHRLDTGNFMMFFKKVRSRLALGWWLPLKWLLDIVALVVCIAVAATLYKCRGEIKEAFTASLAIGGWVRVTFGAIVDRMNDFRSSDSGTMATLIGGVMLGANIGAAKKKITEIKSYINNQPLIQAVSNLVKYYVAQEFIKRRIAHHRLELNFGMTEKMQNNIHNNAQKIEKFVDLRCNRMTMDNLYDELSSTKRKWFGMGGDSQNDAIREFLFNTVFNANGRQISQFILDPGKNREYRQTLIKMSESRSFLGKKDTSFTLFHFVNSYGGIRDISDIAKAFVILSDKASEVKISKVAVNAALKKSISLRKKKHSKKHHIRQHHHPHSHSTAAAAGGSRCRRKTMRRSRHR